MLSEREKEEMLADARSKKRREEFMKAERSKPKSSRRLDDYIAFLMDVQKITPFKHERVITLADRNIL